jgi:hypothetical protein
MNYQKTLMYLKYTLMKMDVLDMEYIHGLDMKSYLWPLEIQEDLLIF